MNENSQRKVLRQRSRGSNLAYLTMILGCSTLCPKIIGISAQKTEPVTAGADATVYVRLLFNYSIYIWPINQTNAVASAPAVTGSVIYSEYFWDQCRVRVIINEIK